MHLVLLLTGILLGVYSSGSFALNGFFANINATTIPTTVITGKEIVLEYVLTDNSQGPLKFIDQSNMPSGTTKTSGSGYCGSTIDLAAGGSCNAQFVIPAQSSGTTITGQIQEHIKGTDFTPIYTPFSIRIVSTPEPGMPTLTLSRTDIHLYPGTSNTTDVTNDSNSTIANYVKFITNNASISDKIDTNNTTSCAFIAASGTCSNMTITANANATAVSSVPIQIQGANTYPGNATVTIDEAVSASALIITSVGDTNLTLTDHASLAAHVDAVSLGASLHGITVSRADCATLNGSNGTCNLVLTATNAAYGGDNITIAYHLGDSGVARSINASTTVSNATVALYYGNNTTLVPDNHILVEYEFSPQSYRFKNTGNFQWRNPTLSLGTLTGVTLTDVCSNATPINPDSYCTFNVTTGHDANPGQSAQLVTTGDNLGEVDSTVIVNGGLSITIETDGNYTHMGYKAIRIDNNTDGDITLESVNVTNNMSSKVTYCAAPGTAGCTFNSDNSCANSGALSASSNCHLWFKAENDTALGSSSGNLDVEVKVQGWSTDPERNNFTANYSYDLYAAGDFTTAGGVTVNRIAKWNGAAWSNLGSGMGGYARPVAGLKGDLYVGGGFTTSGGVTTNRIARWNGTAWSAVGVGIGGDEVVNLAESGNTIYVGGGFINSGASTVNRIAKLNGTVWYPLGAGLNNYVFNLKPWNEELYVSGLFTTANGSTANYVAKWNDSTSLWSTFGNGANGMAGPLLVVNGELYVGGWFTAVNGSSLSANHIAKWNGTAWSTWGGTGTNDNVYSLASSGNDIYVGGAFTTVNGSSKSRLAKWNGTDWSNVGASGANGEVRGLVYVGTDLYVTGHFTTVGGVTANRIAKWNGTAWSPLDTGFNDKSWTNSSAVPSLVLSVR